MNDAFAFGAVCVAGVGLWQLIRGFGNYVEEVEKSKAALVESAKAAEARSDWTAAANQYSEAESIRPTNWWCDVAAPCCQRPVKGALPSRTPFWRAGSYFACVACYESGRAEHLGPMVQVTYHQKDIPPDWPWKNVFSALSAITNAALGVICSCLACADGERAERVAWLAGSLLFSTVAFAALRLLRLLERGASPEELAHARRWLQLSVSVKLAGLVIGTAGLVIFAAGIGVVMIVILPIIMLVMALAYAVSRDEGVKDAMTAIADGKPSAKHAPPTPWSTWLVHAPAEFVGFVCDNFFWLLFFGSIIGDVCAACAV